MGKQHTAPSLKRTGNKDFQPTKMALAVASVAAISLVLVAIIAMY